MRNEKKTAVSIGKFECLHRGHQKLVANILAQEKNGLSGTVVTINQSGAPQLLTVRERERVLAKLGVGRSVPYFLEDIRMTAPEMFVKEVLVDRLHAAYVTCGTDFRFGHDCKGDARLLCALGDQYGFAVEPVEKERQDGRVISSTWVKEALCAGDMETVNRLLGFCYFLDGTVAHGSRLGHRLGMPTANLLPEADKLLPPAGVYASLTETDGAVYQSITNVGRKPSVQGKDAPVSAETYLYDFHADLYGKEIRVKLLKRFRAEQKFADIAKLQQQMRADLKQGERYFGSLANGSRICG